MLQRYGGVIAAGCLVLAASCSNGSDGRQSAGTATRSTATPTTLGDPLAVRTDAGVVRGGRSGVAGVRAFLAIPYAAAPLGKNRWRTPQHRARFPGVFDATKTGASCPQDTARPDAVLARVPAPVEDCLTLSVWSRTEATGLPVMVWIHGGGFISGSAHQPLYVGDHLAARGVVVVDVNYRIGVFGFLATRELAHESKDGSYGNYGLADQTAALEWVHRNIARFGGDPADVTIFGQSSGATSVCAHLDSPASKGLFRRAIIESAIDCHAYQSAARAQSAGAALLHSFGCSNITCLRAVPTSKLVAADFAPSLVGDGVRLPTTTRRLGGPSDVNVLVGSNADEARIFTVASSEPSDDELMRLAGDFTDDAGGLVALYPKGSYSSNLDRYRAMWTDARYVCPSLTTAQTAAENAYVYYFSYNSPSETLHLGPTHATELAFIFDHPEGVKGGPTSFDRKDASFSDAIEAAWVRFAASGTPGASSTWQPYASGGKSTTLDRVFSLGVRIRDGRCGAVNQLVRHNG